MPTTKQIANIGQTSLSVVKGDGGTDVVDFTLPHNSSPNTVMEINGDSSSTGNTTVSSGIVSVHNLLVNGSITTSGSTTAPNITIGDKLFFTDSSSQATDTHSVIGSIYASTGTTANDHILYIDPYQEDSTNDGVQNKGTVHILGSLIVDGDKTILDTATTVTAENAIRVNTTGDGTTAGIATSGGLEFLYNNGTTTEIKTLYYDHSGPHWTTGSVNFTTTGTVTGGSLTDGTATLSGGTLTGNVTGNITSAGSSTFSTVDINGGHIDGTIIGSASASTGRFTTITAISSILSNGAITASGTVTGGTLTDGTASLSGGSLSSAVAITASGTIQGGTLTDGTASLSGGTLSGVTTISAGSITATGTIQGSTIQGSTLTDGTASLSGGSLSASTITLTSTTASTDQTTGALLVSGGVAIRGTINTPSIGNVTNTGDDQLNVTTHMRVLSSRASTSTSSGALTVSGGVGIGGTLNVGIIGNSSNKVTMSTGLIVSGGDLNVNSGLQTVFSDSTESNNTTSGAITISGGVGIGKNLNIGNNVNISGTTDSVGTTIGSGALVVEGGVSIKRHLYLGQGTTGVLGDVVLVSLSGGTRLANPRVLGGDSASAAPLGSDIINYFNSKSLGFGTGQFTVSLVEDVISGGETAAAAGTFLYAGGTLKLLIPLEVSSTNLSVEIDGSVNTVKLINNLANDAFYQVRILTLADTASAQNGY